MQASAEVDQFVISEQEQGLRIDKILTERFEGYSRTYFQYLLDEGYVLLNGAKVKKRIAPKLGDEVEIFFQITEEISLDPENHLEIESINYVGYRQNNNKDYFSIPWVDFLKLDKPYFLERQVESVMLKGAQKEEID